MQTHREQNHVNTISQAVDIRNFHIIMASQKYMNTNVSVATSISLYNHFRDVTIMFHMECRTNAARTCTSVNVYPASHFSHMGETKKYKGGGNIYSLLAQTFISLVHSPKTHLQKHGTACKQLHEKPEKRLQHSPVSSDSNSSFGVGVWWWRRHSRDLLLKSKKLSPIAL